jgi:pilus assembly protein CpaE
VPEPILVLLICADRDAAGRLAGVIQSRGHKVIATPYGPSAMTRATEAGLIVVDRVDGPVPATSVVARMKGTAGIQDVPLLAIAQSDQVEERIGLLEAGADDVMAHPVDGSELEARLDVLLVRSHVSNLAASAEPAADVRLTHHRLLAFFSPKGGVGTTTAAVNCAISLAMRNKESVALVDLDLGRGQVATHLNLTPRLTVVELARDGVALEDPDLIRGFAEMHARGLSVFAAPQRPDQSALLAPEHVARLLDGLAAAYDVIVVDGGSTFDERALTLFEHAERIVLTVSPEIPAVRAVHSLMEVLAEFEGPSERQFFVLNHLFASEMLRTDDLQRSLQANIGAELHYDAVLYLKAVNEGVPVVIGSPRSIAADRLNRLATLLMGELHTPVVGVEAPKRMTLAGLLRRG